MSCSHALLALILITCEGRRGEWVSLHKLIGRLEAPGHLIEQAAAQLVAENKLAHATHAGHPYWGTGVEGLMPQPESPNPRDPHRNTLENPQ